MAKQGFIYEGIGIDIQAANWIDKMGTCEKQDSECALCVLGEGGKIKCKNNLVGHCCKHVVFGMDSEKERYRNVVNELGMSDVIPDGICSENDKVIKIYEELSHKVLKTTSAISLSGENGNIRVVCEGQDIMSGASDFLGYVKIKDEWSAIEHYRFGIISSFFNYASSESYTLFRLCHQRYYEARNIGKKISPTLLVRQSGWSIADEDIDLSQIDYAFDQAKLFYRIDKSDNDYSKGSIYYFFHERNKRDLEEMYRRIASLQPIRESKRPGNIIWDSNKNEVNDALRNIIKEYEKVYNSKIIMEYLLICADPDFKPGMYFGIEKEDYALDFADILGKSTGRYLKKNNTNVLYEMIIQRRYLERKANMFEMHYGKKCMPRILEIIKENATKESSIGSAADYSAFSIILLLVEYFMAVYVFINNCEITHAIENEHHKEFLRKHSQKFLDSYYRVRFDIIDVLFEEWWGIFDDLFGIEKSISKIRKLI